MISCCHDICALPGCENAVSRVRQAIDPEDENGAC